VRSTTSIRNSLLTIYVTFPDSIKIDDNFTFTNAE
jgi:hypothetical protein